MIASVPLFKCSSLRSGSRVRNLELVKALSSLAFTWARSLLLLDQEKISPPHHPDLLHRYMDCTPFKPCPLLSSSSDLFFKHPLLTLPRLSFFMDAILSLDCLYFFPNAAAFSGNDGYFPPTLSDSRWFGNPVARASPASTSLNSTWRLNRTILTFIQPKQLRSKHCQLDKIPGTGPIRLLFACLPHSSVKDLMEK